jgi:hypothetical protein
VATKSEQELSASQRASALHSTAATLGTVLSYINDAGEEDRLDIRVTTTAPTAAKKEFSHTVTCTSDTTRGRDKCRKLAKEMEKQGCDCKSIKNGQSCNCPSQ